MPVGRLAFFLFSCISLKNGLFIHSINLAIETISLVSLTNLPQTIVWNDLPVFGIS